MVHNLSLHILLSTIILVSRSAVSHFSFHGCSAAACCHRACGQSIHTAYSYCGAVCNCCIYSPLTVGNVLLFFSRLLCVVPTRIWPILFFSISYIIVACSITTTREPLHHQVLQRKQDERMMRLFLRALFMYAFMWRERKQHIPLENAYYPFPSVYRHICGIEKDERIPRSRCRKASQHFSFFHCCHESERLVDN